MMKTNKLLQNCVSMFLLSAVLIMAFSAEASRVTVEKDGAGEWRLLSDGEPYFVKGVVFSVSVVGDDPDLGTLRDWTTLDLNKNGRNDVAYDSWVDKNGNNLQDPDEPVVGDWQLLKKMGVNTIRLYQMPTDDARVDSLYVYPGSRLTFVHPPNKEIFRDLNNNYGIKIIAGHFFGEWAIGSGAEWEPGTDYTDPVQRKNLLNGIRVMVEEHKDEPYILMWMLGNENFNPYDHDNAEKEIEAFLTLVNEAAELIHLIDGNHPVALCNWDMKHLDKIARFAPALDIFSMNTYRWGLPEEYNTIKTALDRPVLLSEYGFQAKLKKYLDEGAQVRYHMKVWKDVALNAAGGRGAGNSIGGLIFSWNDQWHLGDDPWVHDTGKFLDVEGAEWYGITGQGDGTKSPFMRNLRKTYYAYQDLWSE